MFAHCTPLPWRAVRKLGAAAWMRAGCIVGIFVFLATPNAKLFSWNYAALFVMSVASNTLANCCLAAVSARGSIVISDRANMCRWVRAFAPCSILLNSRMVLTLDDRSLKIYNAFTEGSP